MKLIMENWRKFLNEEEKPGLWANIRAKRARGESPAEPGDEDYPSEKSWEKVTQDESIEEETRDKYGSQVADRSKRSREKGLVGEDQEDLQSKIRKALRDEGGAAGMDALRKHTGVSAAEIRNAIKDQIDVGRHEDGDYILDDDDEIEIELDEKKKKKKACKPSKGKRFAKRVDGKCRSFGQAGKAKGGGDRIRPGTAKGDAYCARSAKIKKCKNPPCANTLSRKKWKCKGSKSMKESV
tara:strand:+ start:214 stop:930 length:717 start_codon:yes stop_codon:yes gene_type:complete